MMFNNVQRVIKASTSWLIDNSGVAYLGNRRCPELFRASCSARIASASGFRAAATKFRTGLESVVWAYSRLWHHLGINALISGSTLSSPDQCSHLGINALISGSMLSSPDQRSHLRI